ncbi:hypothetical protein MMAGJ_52130 [Mycolicibacterium mageritense]|uniref:Secreted protein n=1 Tax=Mycolicibacterium mageritense TaxID=53462 RepID=A0ABM7HZB0_MYCME|nr:hypothetical protein MMAGJ_52130 [Mycolicibacterium mageritense]GJJ17607.1 hypothetical protein MTY414_12800 [Mycolicibacterium mageritense]
MALHCTHAGLVYTVTVIFGTAPLAVSERSKPGLATWLDHGARYTSATSSPPKFLAPEAAFRPVVKPTPPDSLRSGGLPNCGGLSVSQTLHLVARHPKPYNMF